MYVFNFVLTNIHSRNISLMYLRFDVIFQTSNNSILTADVWGSMMIMNGELEINVENTATT